jgi:uncharacterized membrane protein YgcG
MKQITPARWLRITAALVLVGMAAAAVRTASADEPSLKSAPPVVVKTVPVAGSTGVDPGLTEVSVTYSKPMMDQSWSWSTWGEESVLQGTAAPHYLSDARTCVLPVKLQPGKFYATWLNSDSFHNFQDSSGRPAVPYLLTFETAKAGMGGGAGGGGRGGSSYGAGAGGGGGGRGGSSFSAADGGGGGGRDALLNQDQRAVLEWTDRQFRSFFDGRNYNGWSETERANLETKSLDALNGPRNREYYSAIGTLAALRPQKAVQPLLAIATDRAEKDCRDRWMAIRALGMIGDKAVVPQLIPLVYYGNANTHWWAQISLVRLTGQNFGSDWPAWGKWWDSQGGQPPYNPEIIRWWSGQPEPEKLAETLRDSDSRFLQSIREKARGGQTSAESEESASASAKGGLGGGGGGGVSSGGGGGGGRAALANDPLAACRIVAFGGDRSDDVQSYGGSGPAIRFKPADFLSSIPAGETVALKGVRLYASRYGANYSPEETKLKVQVLDNQDAKLAEVTFPYAKFGFRAGWVNLVFDKPVLVKQPGELLTIAVDPEATRNKGVYFHFQKNPADSHSLAGTVKDGFKTLSDREWLIRACFEQPSGGR